MPGPDGQDSVLQDGVVHAASQDVLLSRFQDEVHQDDQDAPGLVAEDRKDLEVLFVAIVATDLMSGWVP